MIMAAGIRKFALTAHVASSVGSLGAIAAFRALAIAGLISSDAQMMRSAYLAMDLTARAVIVPLVVASLLTGLVQSLGTAWGLFPALLGADEILAVAHCGCRSAASNTADQLHGWRLRAYDLVQRGLPRGEEFACRSRDRRFAGAPARHHAVSLQAARHDPVRMEQAEADVKNELALRQSGNQPIAQHDRDVPGHVCDDRWSGRFLQQPEHVLHGLDDGRAYGHPDALDDGLYV